ncbi:FAD:protein FMN transferase [Paenibacillus polymyxa]|uniref:FAD:protein FMN transferase n=1 Tax=Paenibacillus polymyxa TaxID=1406 RepID=UPI0039BC9575
MRTIQLKNQVINSSGTYELFFIKDGVRYHHILDPSAGAPAQCGVESVTIISKNGEALDKGAFLMGVKDELAYIDSLDNVEAYFIIDIQEFSN